MKRARLVAFVLVALAWGGVARAQNADQPASDQKLQELEGQIQQSQAARDQAAAHAAEIAREVDTLRAQAVAAAAAAQEHEDTLTDLEGRLFELDGDVAAKEAALERTRAQTNGVIAALARLASNPTGALIAEPAPPADTVRAAILLRAALPDLDQAARKLRDDLAALGKARAALAAHKEKFAGTVEKLDADHKQLAALYAKRKAARDQAETESKETETRLAALAGEAADMRDLLARLDAERDKLRQQKEAVARQAEADRAKRALEEQARAAAAKPPPPKLFSQAQGLMPFPAHGTVAVHYGQVNDAGLAAKGISIATRPGAEVVTPFDGEVDFAGPFRGYGLLLIIEHGEGYHTLLAGMARIDCQVGQHLVAGEPVGVMVDSEEKPILYVELRHQGQPINPLPWLAARKPKVTE